MNSPSDSPSASSAGSRPALRRRPAKGRTFRPRHRLSKPKIETASSGAPPELPAFDPQVESTRDPSPTKATPGHPPAPSGEGQDYAARATTAEEDTDFDSEGDAHSEATGPGHDAESHTDGDVDTDETTAEMASDEPSGAAPSMLPGSVEALSYRPASPRSVEDAVLEVKRVVDALQRALQDMEEVLELIEDAEQQQTTDEREIQRLHEVVRQLTQARERVPAVPAPERRRVERVPAPAPPQTSSAQTPQHGHGPGHGHAPAHVSAEDHHGGRRRRRGRGRGRGHGPGDAGGGNASSGGHASGPSTSTPVVEQPPVLDSTENRPDEAEREQARSEPPPSAATPE